MSSLVSGRSEFVPPIGRVLFSGHHHYASGLGYRQGIQRHNGVDSRLSQ